MPFLMSGTSKVLRVFRDKTGILYFIYSNSATVFQCSFFSLS